MSSSILTPEEIAFLDKINKQKQKHNEAQAKYRASKADEIKVYNQNYHKQKRIQLQEINNKLLIEPTPTPINIQQITEIPKIDKRTRRGKKQALTVDIKPIYETRKEPLELSTIKAYLDKANIINKIFKKSPLSQEVKAELKKLLNDNPNLNEPLILAEMDYIKKDIESTIQTLRTHYKNDNSFKNYMNILVVISSHLKSIDKNIYQTLTKTNIFINKEIQSKREDNEVAPKDEGKIIDLDKTTILTNIQKLDNIDDRLLYALYTLMPARRLEWRSVKLTTETNINKLNDINYLIISTSPKQIIFNDYKTYKTNGKQIFEIPQDLDDVINRYLSIKGLKSNDYLFSLDRNKQEYQSEGNFSKKISNIFNKVYGIPISLRFIRQSWVSNLMKTNPSTKAMKQLANAMAHSTEEQAKYNKILK